MIRECVRQVVNEDASSGEISDEDMRELVDYSIEAWKGMFKAKRNLKSISEYIANTDNQKGAMGLNRLIKEIEDLSVKVGLFCTRDLGIHYVKPVRPQLKYPYPSY